MKVILIDAIHCLVIKWEWVFKEMHDLLETFPHRKIVLTSADDEQIKIHSLDELPYEYYTLKHNPEKSDPTYYKSMLSHFWLAADEVVYFEHSIDAVESAQSIWINAYHYDKVKKNLKWLKHFLDINA